MEGHGVVVGRAGVGNCGLGLWAAALIVAKTAASPLARATAVAADTTAPLGSGVGGVTGALLPHEQLLFSADAAFL